eukprot:scaffold44830_cov52-Phaeocystis_antarctica.AAC.1
MAILTKARGWLSREDDSSTYYCNTYYGYTLLWLYLLRRAAGSVGRTTALLTIAIPTMVILTMAVLTKARGWLCREDDSSTYY